MAKKKTTLDDIAALLKKQSSEIGDLTDSVAFVVKRMATKDDIADVNIELKADITTAEKRLVDRIDSVKVRVNGIQSHLDAETLKRQDQKLPDRMTRVEKHLGLDHKIVA